ALHAEPWVHRPATRRRSAGFICHCRSSQPHCGILARALRNRRGTIAYEKSRPSRTACAAARIWQVTQSAMETPFQNDPTRAPQEMRGGASRQILLSVIVIFAGIGTYFVLFRSSLRPASPAGSQLAFGSQEQAYAPNLHLGNFAMKQAEN